jgi:hypothetical protein
MGAWVAGRMGGPATAGGFATKTGEWIAVHIPALGFSLSNSSLAPDTRYYVYLYDNAGAWALEASTTATTVDTASGYQVKSGDASRHYVGSVKTDGKGAFLTANTGWLNPSRIAGSQTGVDCWMWYSGTSAALRRTTNALPSSDTDGVLV